MTWSGPETLLKIIINQETMEKTDIETMENVCGVVWCGVVGWGVAWGVVVIDISILHLQRRAYAYIAWNW